MGYQDQTDIGGVRDAFFTTHWSLIEGVKKHQDRDQVLIGLLIERYWKPVYCYLRRKGYQNEQAKDLTQSFFHEVVLNRRLDLDVHDHGLARKAGFVRFFFTLWANSSSVRNAKKALDYGSQERNSFHWM